jgi:hypothetical protein
MHSGADAGLREITLQLVPVLGTYDIEMVHGLTIQEICGQRNFWDRL